MGSRATSAQDSVRPVTPGQLTERFCGKEAAGLRADYGVTTKDGITTARGFCGYIGGRGDMLKTGFSDGYDFVEYLNRCGWSWLREKGSWPYVVYMEWQGDEQTALVEYREGDLTVSVFENVHERAGTSSDFS
jgi:hypothetical protein